MIPLGAFQKLFGARQSLTLIGQADARRTCIDAAKDDATRRAARRRGG